MLNDDSNRLAAPVCPHCLSSLRRLFIKQQKSPPTTTESQARKCHNLSPITTSNFIASLLILFCLLALSWSQQANGQLSANLPTVIVRGFLNYRTTVDGTVLLFTPDAGGSTASQTNQPISSTSTLVRSSLLFNVASHNTLFGLGIEPTSVLSQLVSATTFLSIDPPLSSKPDDQPLIAVGRDSDVRVIANNEPKPVAVAAPAAVNDEWHPIQATPPLQPMQTAFRPTFPSSKSSSSIEPMVYSSLTNLEPSVGTHRLLSSSKSNIGAESRAQPDLPAQKPSTPSVQSEDVLVGAEPAQSSPPSRTPFPATQRGHSASAGPTTTETTQPPARASRPKRPSLGFNGQGLRSRTANRPQTGNQAEAQATNTINGIRRPGLSTTTSTTSAPSTADQPPSTIAISASTTASHPARLTNASAKLRNRFRRPPIGGNSSQIVPVAQSAALIQPTESGDDLVIGEQSAVAEAASSQSRSPDQLSLQSRMGDIFNPTGPIGTSPVVGSDEVLLAATSRDTQVSSSSGVPSMAEGSATQPDQNAGDASLEPVAGTEAAADQLQEPEVKPISRSGEQRPRDNNSGQEPQLLSGGLSTSAGGGLQQGQLSNMPLNFDSFFQSDQPGQQVGAEPSEHQPSHHVGGKELPAKSMKNNNEKLNGWLDQHHNKFIPRPAANPQHEHQSGHLSHQLAANLNNLAPSFASNIPSSSSLKPTPVGHTHMSGQPLETLKPSVGSVEELTAESNAGSNKSQPVGNGTQSSENGGSSMEKESVQMQTITKTYSTVMTSFKTRLVPLQVKSSTAIHTITENYIITKMLTAYQTMPIGEFILPEPLNTRAPFEMFNEPSSDQSSEKSSAPREQPISAPSHIPAAVEQSSANQQQQQEQPISLDTSPKSANDWLHDFSNNDNNNMGSNSNSPPSQQQQQNALAAALLEQHAQDNNLAGHFGPLDEPLNQLASSLDPAALLADGSINIPDLNNPLVLAAAIQNPQLAAVILAAQQLQLKQRNKLNNNNPNNNNHIQPVQLQPSYSTSLSTQVKQSTYTVRDTMYTTRLVSFKDGRTVRTRTVSEPGSVVEQVLTTMATEVTPITITIRPTGMFTMPASFATAAVHQGNGGQNGLSSSQSTLNNALFATQLAGILARRQQQVQPSMASPGGAFLAAAASNAMNSQNNQLAALQQLIGQQQQRQQTQQVAAKQFQPNFQQMLQSMQHQQQSSLSPSSLTGNNRSTGSQTAAAAATDARGQQLQETSQGIVSATPILPAAAPAINAAQTLPITTTLTNLQLPNMG